MDINNKTLAIFLVAGMVFSLFSTVVIMNRFSDMGITGFLTTDNSTGTVKYNISSNVVINFSEATIDFGTGWVKNNQNCIMNTTGAHTTDNCLGEFETDPETEGWVLDNVGNKNASVTLSYNNTRIDFFTFEGDGSDIRFRVKDTDGGCPTVANTAWTSITQTSPYTICSEFDFNTAHNTMDIDIELTLNYQEAGQEQSISVFAEATEV